MATNVSSVNSDIEIANILDRVNRYHSCKVFELKAKQRDAILACESRDVLGVLPTGYGKTVVIQCLPYLNDSASTVVVVNPLNAILEEQHNRLGDRSVIINHEDVDYLSNGCSGSAESEKKMKRVKSGYVNFILGHPEHLCSVAVKRFLMSEDISSKISHIIVDEAHCVISWGKSNFRPAFLKVGDLRAILPQAGMLALTATATIKAQHEIQQALCMVNPLIVAETPDRPNIYLEVEVRPPSTGSGHSVETSYETVLDPVLLTSRTDGIHFDRTIIYLPLKWCGHIHHRAITRSLLLNQENQETEQGSVEASLKCFIAQYYAPQTQEMKSLITQQMKKPDGQVRLLLATEAYGMGADSPNVHSIIHVGPPNTIETYTQEIGRGGRDGLQSSATLYFNKSDIAANNEHLDDAMRQYCLLKSCRREYLTRYFGFDLARENKHYCCDNCRKLCTCSECHQSKSNFNSSKTGTKHVGKKPVSKIRIQAARSMLASYFAAENSLVTEICIPSLSTGLSDKLIGVITKDINTYTDVSLLKENFPDVDMTFATNISAILSKVMSLDLSD